MMRFLPLLLLSLPCLSLRAQEAIPTLVPLFTLPADASVLGEIEDMDFLPSGEILVLDTQVKQILVYDASGSLVRTLGREGQGPGEIRGAFEIETTDQGGIWILDNGNARLSRWSSDGRPEVTRLFQELFGGFAGWPDDLVLTPAGAFLKMIPFMPGDPVRFFKLNADLSGVADTVSAVIEGEGASTCNFCPMMVGPSGRILAAQGDTLYAVSELGRMGEALSVFRRGDLPAVRRTDAEMEALNAAVGRLPIPEGVSAPRPEFPRHKSRFGSLSIGVDDRERIWLLPSVAEGENGVLDLFSTDGGYMTSIPLDGPVRGFRIRGNRLLARSETPLGEPLVRVYEIR